MHDVRTNKIREMRGGLRIVDQILGQCPMPHQKKPKRKSCFNKHPYPAVLSIANNLQSAHDSPCAKIQIFTRIAAPPQDRPWSLAGPASRRQTAQRSAEGTAQGQGLANRNG